MDFYFYMYLDCPMQEALSSMQFIERLGLAGALRRSDRAHGVDPENPGEADQAREIKVRMNGAERMMKRAEVRELSTDFLGSARMHCMQCPVNQGPEPFGCVGEIPLPLSAKAEKWLLDQFAPPEPEKSFFLQHIRLARLPARRHELLLAAPEEFKKTFGPERTELTSTQLFYTLLNMRELPYRTRLWMLYEFGAIKARAREVEELATVISSATEGGEALAGRPEMDQVRKAFDRFKVKLKFEKTDDEQIRMLKQYFLFALKSLNGGIRMYASLM